MASEEMEVDELQDTGADTDEEGGLRIDDEIYIPPPPRNADKIDTNGPRLMISHIVNMNLKSYCGKQTIGPFHKCFSAIIGPNGSGKSNVIDSMLFVFGYRASKIRSKKISVLIHNSSENPDCRSCSVSVHFQQIIDKPGADFDIVPNSEFSISRTAFKDSSSYYELSGKRVQFKEIAKLLRSHGVDLDHNRFLILQGEVEQIAMMKPKAQTEHDTGMLEFLEDIIGTSRYKEPLEKLYDKVDLLTELRAEKLTRLRAVEKAKSDLEQPMQEAVQYLKMENNITKLKHQLYHCKRYDAVKELEELKEGNAELDKDHADLVQNMKKVRESKEEKNNEFKEKSKQWHTLQQKKDALTIKFNDIKKQDEGLHEELVATNKRRKENNATVKLEKTKLEDLSKVPQKNAKDIEECENLSKKYRVDHEKEELALEKLMTSLKTKTEPLLERRTKLETVLVTHRKNVNEAKAKFDIAESKLQLYTASEATEKK